MIFIMIIGKAYWTLMLSKMINILEILF